MLDGSFFGEADIMPNLTKRQQDLTRCESDIHQGIAWLDRGRFLIGRALIEIRDNKLYLDTHDALEAYVFEMWDRSRDWAYKLISAEKTRSNVESFIHQHSDADVVPMPRYASHAALLSSLPEEEQGPAWCEVVTQVQGHPTIRQLREALAYSGDEPETDQDDDDIITDADVVFLTDLNRGEETPESPSVEASSSSEPPSSAYEGGGSPVQPRVDGQARRTPKSSKPSKPKKLPKRSKPGVHAFDGEIEEIKNALLLFFSIKDYIYNTTTIKEAGILRSDFDTLGGHLDAIFSRLITALESTNEVWMYPPTLERVQEIAERQGISAQDAERYFNARTTSNWHYGPQSIMPVHSIAHDMPGYLGRTKAAETNGQASTPRRSAQERANQLTAAEVNSFTDGAKRILAEGRPLLNASDH